MDHCIVVLTAFGSAQSCFNCPEENRKQIPSANHCCWTGNFSQFTWIQSIDYGSPWEEQAISLSEYYEASLRKWMAMLLESVLSSSNCTLGLSNTMWRGLTVPQIRQQNRTTLSKECDSFSWNMQFWFQLINECKVLLQYICCQSFTSVVMMKAAQL